MSLNFEYKTPANFYDGLVKVDENEAALKKWGMVVIDLDSLPSKELPIHLILHRYNISKVYINGKLEKEN